MTKGSCTRHLSEGGGLSGTRVPRHGIDVCDVAVVCRAPFVHEVTDNADDLLAQHNRVLTYA